MIDLHLTTLILTGMFAHVEKMQENVSGIISQRMARRAGNTVALSLNTRI